MRILSKSIAMTLLFGISMVQASSPLYSIMNNCFKIGRFGNAFMGSIMKAGYGINYERKIRSAPDASEVIIHFCHEKLKKHGLDPSQIQIKVKEDSQFLETWGKNFIVFSPIADQELENALKDSSDTRSINIVKIYSTFLDHEIAHLKNNDTLKRQGVLLGASALGYGIATGLMSLPHTNPLFQKATNKIGLLKLGVAYTIVNVGTSLFTQNIYNWYARYQENMADAYAISHAKDPQALHYSATFLELVENSIIDFLCGANLHPSIMSINRILLMSIRNMLIRQYQTLKPKEDFRTWVQQQSTVLSQAKFILDPSHPSGFYRAQILRTAANALEEKQKAVVAEATQAA